MPATKIIELTQGDDARQTIEGLYLDKRLPPEPDEGTWLYMSFVTSLDGRISLAGGRDSTRVPANIANPRDWRLFQELAAHSECLVTTSRYLHELKAGTAQATLPVDHIGHPDLGDWRLNNGHKEQPDVAVVGNSLDYTLPPAWFEQGRQVWLFPPSKASEEAINRHNRAGAKVAAYFAGSRVAGGMIKGTLAKLGYRRIFCIGGPQLAHSLLADNALDSLFLTVRQRIIGGEQGAYENIVEGAALDRGIDFELQWLYLDRGLGAEAGQQFTRYDRISG